MSLSLRNPSEKEGLTIRRDAFRGPPASLMSEPRPGSQTASLGLHGPTPDTLRQDDRRFPPCNFRDDAPPGELLRHLLLDDRCSLGDLEQSICKEARAPLRLRIRKAFIAARRRVGAPPFIQISTDFWIGSQEIRRDEVRPDFSNFGWAEHQGWIDSGRWNEIEHELRIWDQNGHPKSKRSGKLSAEQSLSLSGEVAVSCYCRLR